MEINILINRFELERQVENIIETTVCQYFSEQGWKLELADDLVEEIIKDLNETNIKLIIDPDE